MNAFRPDIKEGAPDVGFADVRRADSNHVSEVNVIHKSTFSLEAEASSLKITGGEATFTVIRKPQMPPVFGRMKRLIDWYPIPRTRKTMRKMLSDQEADLEPLYRDGRRIAIAWRHAATLLVLLHIAASPLRRVLTIAIAWVGWKKLRED